MSLKTSGDLGTAQISKLQWTVLIPTSLDTLIHILSFPNAPIHLFSEDEQQQKSISCSKSVRQLTLERDQAVSDLNSVERSFADLFRRYENMKGVLEGFKKVSANLA